MLANPIGLGAAALGAPALWRKHRAVAIVCLVLAVLYLNEVWLAPFPTHTTLNLRRGLTVLAIPVSLAAGVYLAQRSRRELWLIGASAAWALDSLFVAVPDSCYTRPIDVGELRGLQVHRCTFRWRGPHIKRTASPAPAWQGRE